MKNVRGVTLASTILVFGCSSQPETEQNGLKFLTFNDATYGLTAKVKQPTLNVCLTGATKDTLVEWQTNISKVILQWVEPLRSLSPDVVLSNVNVVDSLDGRATDCGATVRIAEGTWSNTMIGTNPTVSMSPTGYFASYNVLLHEMGHAFALGDTYEGGQSGKCLSGQPQSVMCNTSFDQLQDDDIAGITQVFKSAFSPKVDEPADATKPENATASENSQPRTDMAEGESFTETATLPQPATDSVDTCSCGLDATGKYCVVTRNGAMIAYSDRYSDDGQCEFACKRDTGRFRFVMARSCTP